MKSKQLSILLITIVIALMSKDIYAQKKHNPWSEKQLMEPAELARMIEADVDKPIVFCVGPANYIKGAVYIGSLTEKENVETFKQQLSKLPKDTSIVVYCGCCPFEHCPNIRPAMNILEKMKFSNQKLLNLTHNAKVDWIDKGYPTE